MYSESNRSLLKNVCQPALFNVYALKQCHLVHLNVLCVFFIIYMLFIFSHILYEYITPINQVALLLSSFSDFVVLSFNFKVI